MAPRAYSLPTAFALAERGMCTSQIANELGVSMTAVRNWARRNEVVLPDGRQLRAIKREPAPRSKVFAYPRSGFTNQVSNAKRRGIDWLLTFEEWWSIWQESGKWNLRGRGAGCYVMARHGDVGPYSVGNVFICSHADNVRQAWNAGRTSPPPSNFGKGRGWVYEPQSKTPYVVKVSGKGVGRFETQEEAESAYRTAVAAKAAAPFHN